MAKIRCDAVDKDILYARMSGLLSRICGEFRLKAAGTATDQEKIECLREWLNELCKGREKEEPVRTVRQDMPELHEPEVEE